MRMLLGGKKMLESLHVKLSESELKRLKEFAKISNKTLSEFVRQKLREAINKDIEEVNVLNDLINVLKDLKTSTDIYRSKANNNDIELVIDLLKAIALNMSSVPERIKVMEQKIREVEAKYNR
jgi:predicted DNA-binding protein